MLSFEKQANILSKLDLLSLTQHGKNRQKNLLTILLKTSMRDKAPLSYVTYFTNTNFHDPHNPLRELRKHGEACVGCVVVTNPAGVAGKHLTR